MITMGIALGAGVFYWLAWYKLAFWISLTQSPTASWAHCVATITSSGPIEAGPARPRRFWFPSLGISECLPAICRTCARTLAGVVLRAGNTAQETGKIVGDMIDMGCVAAGELPLLAQHHASAFRHNKHRGHAERMRHFEIAGEIFEYRGLGRIDLVAGEETLINLRPRLGFEFGRFDVEDVCRSAVRSPIGGLPHRRDCGCRWSE